jgi:hypothetical protein
MHLKRMLFLEEAKKFYVISSIEKKLNCLNQTQLMDLYQTVCE